VPAVRRAGFRASSPRRRAAASSSHYDLFLATVLPLSNVLPSLGGHDIVERADRRQPHDTALKLEAAVYDLLRVRSLFCAKSSGFLGIHVPLYFVARML
jgi:hypothetical protein